MKNRDGDIVRGSSFAVQTAPPYVIVFAKDIEIEEKGELIFNVTVKEAGIFKGVSIDDMLSGFSKHVSYVVQLLENL